MSQKRATIAAITLVNTVNSMGFTRRLWFAVVCAVELVVSLIAGPDVVKANGWLEGVRYTSQDRVTVRNESLGMPLGGVGAGKVELTTTGALANFTSLNNWTRPLPTIPGTGFWVRVRRGDSKRAGEREEGRGGGGESGGRLAPLSEGVPSRPLTLSPLLSHSPLLPLSSLPVDFTGSFPFARLRFGGLPVELSLLGWSPLVFHAPKSSAYPLAFFDFEVRNPGPQPAEVTVAFSHGLPPWGPARKWMEVQSTVRPVDTADLCGLSLQYRVDLHRAEEMVDGVYGHAYRYETVDLRPLMNANPLDDTFGDGPGIAFLGAPVGRQEIHGLPFDLVNSATNGSKGCLILHVRHGGSKEVNIPVHRRANVVYFLGNVAGWAHGGEAGYVVRYADGSREELPLVRGDTICDWIGGTEPVLSPAVLTGASQIGPWAIRLLGHVAKDVEIDSIDFVAEGGPMSPLLFAVTLGMGPEQPAPPALREFGESLKRTLKGTVGEVSPEFCLSVQRKAGRVGRAACEDERAVRARILRQSVAQDETNPAGKGSFGVVSVTRRLAVGEKARLRFVYTWFSPHHLDDQGYFHGHKYTTWFTDAWDVAQKAQRDRERLYRETRRLYDLIHGATVPAWLKELWQNSLNIFVSNTWWTAADRYQVYESPDTCPCLDTLDVRYYGSFISLAAFPELTSGVLRHYASLQHKDGFVPHDLGYGNLWWQPGNPRDNIPPPADGNYAGYWTNLPIKFILQVYRDYLWTADIKLLRDLWPHVIHAAAWVRARDADGDGLPTGDYGYDSYSMRGTVSYDAIQWIAALTGMARLAEDLGEAEAATRYRAERDRAVQSLSKFWTTNPMLKSAGYYRHSLADEKTGPASSFIHGMGDWYSCLLGDDNGIPRDRMRASLETVYQINVGYCKLGGTNLVHLDGTRLPGQCDQAWLGMHYPLAAHSIYLGLEGQGLKLAEQIWDHTVRVAKQPWSQDDGADPWTGQPQIVVPRDYRPASSYALLYALSGLVMDLPRGRLSLYPCETLYRPGNFRLPILMPRLYGSISYRRRGTREIYVLDNLEAPLRLHQLGLRTAVRGEPRVNLNPSSSGDCRQEGDKLWISDVVLRHGRTAVTIEHARTRP